MAATVGNKFYLLRLKSGRDRDYSSPQQMLDKVVEYLNEVKLKTISKPELLKSGELAGQQIDLNIPDYPRKDECAHYLGFAKWDTMANYKDYSEDFCEVIEWTASTIQNWQIKGTAAGLYNSNIVARDLGLSDKSDVTVKAEQPLFGETE